MYIFEVIKYSHQIQISYSAKKDTASQKIGAIVWGLLPLSFLAGAIYEGFTKDINDMFVFSLLAVAFGAAFILTKKEDKKHNTYLLTIDECGFHESSVSFKQKDITWGEVCYIDYFPNFIVEGGKTVRKYSILVVSKSPMTEEERFKFLKHQSLGSGIDKSSSPNDIIIASDLMQISRIYQLIAEQAVLHGCEHALQKEVEDD